MTTRLKLYNNALRICGERSLASLTEDREPRRLLDEVWNDGGVDLCLETGQWLFAQRATQLDYDVSVTPGFGYSRAFSKPTDWKTTNAVCSDEYFKVPLLEYVDEAGYWYCDLDIIYVKYVSNHTDYGGDLSTWPELFSGYVAAYFASEIVFKLTSDKEKMMLVEKKLEDAMKKAKNANAMQGPTLFPAPGSWVTSRRGRSRERGKLSQLIG